MDERRYEIEGVLGRGRFGTVYRAVQHREGGEERTVVLKVPNLDTRGQAGILDIIKEHTHRLRAANHEAIVVPDDVVHVRGSWLLVYPYHQSCDLRRIIDATPIPPRAALEIVQEIAGALHVAFTAKGDDYLKLRISHRDIKPSNILVGVEGDVKLLDFTLQRPVDETSELGDDGLAYMSPERLDAIQGPEADVYALGVVLYEMLTGKRMAKTSSHIGRHLLRTEEVREALADVVDDEHEDVRTLVQTMLSYLPHHRLSARDVTRRCGELVASLSEEPSLEQWAGLSVTDLVPEPGHGMSKVFREHGMGTILAVDDKNPPVGGAATAATVFVGRSDGSLEAPPPRPAPLAMDDDTFNDERTVTDDDDDDFEIDDATEDLGGALAPLSPTAPTLQPEAVSIAATPAPDTTPDPSVRPGTPAPPPPSLPEGSVVVSRGMLFAILVALVLLPLLAMLFTLLVAN